MRWDRDTRLAALPVFRAARRLRIFSWVVPRPKEPEGDSLQVAFRLPDAPSGAELLDRLGLVPASALQRPDHGPLAGVTVQATLTESPLDRHGDRRWGQPVALVRLWDERSPDVVSSALVARAVRVERRLAALGADDWPRETDLLSWVPREEGPEPPDA